jgi:hypothetical protein
MTGKEVALRTVIRKVLREYGTDVPENQGLHGWRCTYPDRYGPCDHFDQLVEDLAKQIPQQVEAP